MSFLPIPKYKFRAIESISAELLVKNNIRLLMLDLDNTIAPYGTDHPTKDTQRWVSAIREAGILLCIVSNSRRARRVEAFAEALGVPYVLRAKKPSPRKPRELLRQMNVAAEAAALAGDQIYTDVLSARLAGITPILVKPIKLSNPLLALRYALEAPFRIWRRYA
ncbi:MAG: YqeG family HAD IIIA-type phosphatase [Oscillospiraceae bacterium]|jgi:HAD superfamily phosphatase (TIGR01668 family)|nr:YqeG family HAD IIIA-type phosphatase [Oscillospiraceae bacterium]